MAEDIQKLKPILQNSFNLIKEQLHRTDHGSLFPNPSKANKNPPPIPKIH